MRSPLVLGFVVFFLFCSGGFSVELSAGKKHASKKPGRSHILANPFKLLRRSARVNRTGGSRTARVASVKRSRVPQIRYLPSPSPMEREAALSEVELRLAAPPDPFENSAALVPFFATLTQSLQTHQPLHILQFGDSHTASDDWVHAMRTSFQAKYGSGGPGFVQAGHPYRGYRRLDVSGNGSAGWMTEGTLSNIGDGREGLSGVSISAHRPGEFATLTAAGDRLQIFFLKQPAGGAFTFFVDGKPFDTIETAGDSGLGTYEFLPEPGEHQYEIRTLSDAPVRLFGWTVDNKGGVTVETLGINGAQASLMLNWDQSLWLPEVARRDPALIILAYGTNEANSPKFTAFQYRADLTAVLARVRSAAPAASILMIGPPDCGRGSGLPHLDEVIAVQRAVARQARVAFWDWRLHMGGEGASNLWVRAGLGQNDHIHLTTDGYRLLGRKIFDDLQSQYAVYRAAETGGVALGSDAELAHPGLQ